MSGRYEVKTLVKRTHGLDVVGLISATGETLADISSCPNGAVDAIITELNALLDRAEKAEARVAELEAQVAKAEHPQRRADTAYEFRADVRSAQGSGKFGNTEQAINSTLIRWFEEARNAKTAPKTPAPAPEPTETVQNQAPAAGTDPSRHDPPARGVAAGVEPAPVLGDPRGPDQRTWIELFRLGTAHDRCGGCGKVGSDRFNATCPACKIAFPHNSLARGGKCDPLIACPICTGRIPDPSGPYQTTATPGADAFRVYDEMLRYPGHPQRGLTAEEADAWTELLGKFGSPKPREPDVSAEVGLMGALQDRIHKESGPYRAAKVARVEEPKLVVSCFDARCQCYQCVKDRADEEEDFRDLAKEQARAAAIAKAKDDVYRMSMDILARATVTPEWAAEVEARTGAYGRGLTKAEAAAYEGVLHGFMRDAMKGLGDVIDPPRAGLPSRDEVAAFLEGWWPK